MRTSIEKVLEIKKLQKTNTITKIAKKLNLDRHTVSRWIKRDYLPGDLISKSALVKNNPFENLENRDCMYFLGLLCTDGSVYKNRIELALKESDLSIINKYKDFINVDLKVKRKQKTLGNKIFYSYRVSFRSKKVSKFLNDLGITENKTFTLDPNFDFTWDFIRGVIDGDGSFGIYSGITRIIITTASLDFKNKICNFFEKHNISMNCNKITRNSKTYYNIITTKSSSVLKILDYLYNDTNTFIERKYITARQMRDHLENKDSKLRELVLKNPEASQQFN